MRNQWSFGEQGGGCGVNNHQSPTEISFLNSKVGSVFELSVFFCDLNFSSKEITPLNQKF